ncbi:MAG: FHIPEP family type III secretion protein [Candidatus Avigastranaerophilus sp.]
MIRKVKQFFKKLFKPVDNTGEQCVLDQVNSLYNSLNDDIIHISLGDDLIPFIEMIINTTFNARTAIKNQTGFIIPAIKYSSDSTLQENEISVMIRGNIAFNKFVIPNKENIEKEIKDTLDELYLNNLSDIFSNEMAEKYIDAVIVKNRKLVADISYYFSTVEIRYILKELLENGISIYNIDLIFEKISEQIFMHNNSRKHDIYSISKKIIKGM